MAGQKNLKKMEPVINLKQASSLSGPNLCLIPHRASLKSLKQILNCSSYNTTIVVTQKSTP
jgi:hypothetical protein